MLQTAAFLVETLFEHFANVNISCVESLGNVDFPVSTVELCGIGRNRAKRAESTTLRAGAGSASVLRRWIDNRWPFTCRRAAAPEWPAGGTWPMDRTTYQRHKFPRTHVLCSSSDTLCTLSCDSRPGRKRLPLANAELAARYFAAVGHGTAEAGFRMPGGCPRTTSCKLPGRSIPHCGSRPWRMW